MQSRNKPRPRAERVPGPGLGKPIEREPSPAWQAAQQAFSEQPSLAQPQAVVVVRKGRGQVAAAPVAGGAVADGVAEPQVARPARVFRVSAVLMPSDEAAEAASGRDDSSVSREGDGPRRRRRAASDKRPGPVVRIVPGAASRSPLSTLSGPGGEFSVHQVAALHTLLADVDAVVAEIRLAVALEFVDRDAPGLWLGLWDQAAVIQRHIDAVTATGDRQPAHPGEPRRPAVTAEGGFA